MGWFKRSEHPEEQLSAYIDGELDARQAESVARHLAACSQCTGIVEELRAAKTMLAALPKEAPRRSFVLGPEHARESAPARAPSRRSSFSFAPAVAATILIGLLLVDGINVSTSSQDESGTSAGANKTELSRQAEDSAGGAPVPATAPGQQSTANSGAAAEAAVTPGQRSTTPEGGAGSGTPATPANAPAFGQAPSPTPAPAQAQAPPAPTVMVPPATGNVAPTAVPGGPLSTFGSDVRTPAPDADGVADAGPVASEGDESGISTLRVLQILAGIALIASVFYVYVRPRLAERK